MASGKRKYILVSYEIGNDRARDDALDSIKDKMFDEKYTKSTAGGGYNVEVFDEAEYSALKRDMAVDYLNDMIQESNIKANLLESQHKAAVNLTKDLTNLRARVMCSAPK